MTIKLDLKESAPVQEELRRQFKTSVDSALLELADHLQRNSPRGVSPAGDSLAGGWDVIPSRKARGIIPEVMGSVVNRAEAAEFRIRGRAPGKFPPYGEGSNLAKWAKAAGIPPFLIARKIAQQGTDRWRKRDNILKQDPVSLKFGADSPLHTVYEKRLQEEWKKIKI